MSLDTFEVKPLELESTKETATMEDVIKRLKAADELDSLETYQKGQKEGEQWAKTYARPRQLRSLDKETRDDPYDVVDHIDMWNNNSNIGHEIGIFWAINGGEEEPDRSEAEAFWAKILEDNKAMISDKDFAHGFVKGALRVWDAVESKI
jgi:hypothetical protein